MKTIKVSEATAPALDWLVAKCEGIDLFETEGWLYDTDEGTRRVYRPSTDWSQAGPLIERELIAVSPYGYMDEAWRATTLKPETHFTAYGDTCLIAAMRCYVASKLGDTLEVPEELL